MNITGTFGMDDQAAGVQSGAFYPGGQFAYDASSTTANRGFIMIFDASKSWTGSTSQTNPGNSGSAGSTETRPENST